MQADCSLHSEFHSSHAACPQCYHSEVDSLVEMILNISLGQGMAYDGSTWMSLTRSLGQGHHVRGRLPTGSPLVAAPESE